MKIFDLKYKQEYVKEVMQLSKCEKWLCKMSKFYSRMW